MTEKISLLSIRQQFDAGPYAAGMNAKIAADKAGAASSTQLGNTIQQTYQKISAAGSVSERLSRTYIQGYDQASKFNQAINALGRGLETGNVPMQRADAILSGIVNKFGSTASAAEIAERGYLALSFAVQKFNAELEKQGRLQSQPQVVNQQFNKVLGVSDPGGNTAARAADIEAYGQALDDLRAKYSPLYAVERAHVKQVAEINQAHKVGAISNQELAVALTTAQVAYTNQVRAIDAANKALATTGKNAALSSFAMTNLAFQINDVATMAALGQDPLRILASQAGQFYQILSTGDGGVRGSLTYLRTLLTGLITPARLAVGALGGLAAVGVSAAVSWANAQSAITLALRGIGAAAGVTASDINRISLATASYGELTVSEAREIALALVGTGKVTADVAEQATKLGKGFQLVFGVDNSGAAKQLAAALADPAKGVDDLNKRLGEFDDATAQSIKRMAAQGDRLGAQQLLIDGVSRGVANAASQNNVWARSWDAVSTSASEAYGRIGQFFSPATFEATEDGLKRAKDQLAAMQDAREKAGLLGTIAYTSGINILTKEIERLTPIVEEASAKARDLAANSKSIELGDIVRQVDPLTTQLLDVANQLANIRKLSADPLVLLKLDPATTQALERTKDLLEKRSDPSIPRTPSGFALEDAEVAAKQRMARTNEQRAEAAYAASLAANRRNSSTTAIEDELIASLAYKTTLQDLRREQDLAFEARRFQSAQQIESARLELSLVDAGIGATTQARTEFQLLAQAKAEAFRNGTSVTDAETQAIKREAAALSELAVNLARANVLADIRFDNDQLGRNDVDQAVYSRLRSAGLLDGGKSIDPTIEAALRLDEAMKQVRSTSQDFASTFVHGIADGKNAIESLSGALKQLGNKLIDLGLNSAFNQLFGNGGAGSGLVSGLTNGGKTGGLFGGVIFPGILHEGGIAGNDNVPMRAVSPGVFANATRYHSGGIAGLRPGEVPAILEEGERVIRKRDVAKSFAAQAPRAAATNVTPITLQLSQSFTVSGGAGDDAIVQLKTEMARAVPAMVNKALHETLTRRDRYAGMGRG